MSVVTVGNPAQFGIQYEVAPEPQRGGVWLFGKVCYWITNEMIGDYGLGTSLRDILADPYIVADNGHRQQQHLCALSASEIYGRLEGILYRGDIDHSDKQYIETAARFEIQPKVDVFRDVRIYCLGCDTTARLIYRTPKRTDIREVRFWVVILAAAQLVGCAARPSEPYRDATFIMSLYGDDEVRLGATWLDGKEKIVAALKQLHDTNPKATVLLWRTKRATIHDEDEMLDLIGAAGLGMGYLEPG